MGELEKMMNGCKELGGKFFRSGFGTDVCSFNISGGRISLEVRSKKLIVEKEIESKSVYGVERSRIEIDKDKIVNIEPKRKDNELTIVIETKNNNDIVIHREFIPTSYAYGSHYSGFIVARSKDMEVWI